MKQMTYSPAHLSKKVLEVLPPIVHRLRSQARAAVRGRVTLPQFRILSLLRDEPMTVGEIALAQDVAQPTMSKMVDGMVSRGLLRRIRNKEDRRQIHLGLSAKGRAVFNQTLETIQDHLHDDFSGLSAVDRRRLAVSLDQIQRILG